MGSATTADVERSRSKRVGGVALVSAIVFSAHAAALGNRFLLDDFMAHRADPALRTLTGLVTLISRPRALPDTEPQGAVFRPISAAFDWLSWQLVGSSPFAHHGLDVLLHVGIAVLLFELVVAVGAPRFAPFAALFFGVHPLTTVAVAPLSGRPLLLGMFALLAAHRLLRGERPLVSAALVAALGSAGAVGSHEAYRWAAPLVLGSAVLGGDRRRFVAVLLGAALTSLVLTWWSPALPTSNLPAMLAATTALVARFSAALVWPPSPVLSFTPSPSFLIVAAVGTAALALVVSSSGTRRIVRGPWLGGLALGLLVPLALGVTASETRATSDRGAYVVLVGAVLLAASFVAAATPRFARSVPPWAVLGFVAFVPLDAANAFDLSDELTVAHRLAAGHDEEAALARAILDTRFETALPVCRAYAHSHGPSTRAHGCVAAALLDGRRAEEALPWARAYARDRPHRRHARVLLLQALTALNRTAEIQTLVTAWQARGPGEPERARAPEATP